MSFFEGLKFRKVSSPIHDLDPRVKFIFVIAIFVLAIIFWELFPLIVLFVLQIRPVLCCSPGARFHGFGELYTSSDGVNN